MISPHLSRTRHRGQRPGASGSDAAKSRRGGSSLQRYAKVGKEQERRGVGQEPNPSRHRTEKRPCSVIFGRFRLNANKTSFVLRSRRNRLEEEEILAMTEELLSLIQEQGCRKMILCLGPGGLDCLFSVFLATLVTVRRKLAECGGLLKLCEVPPQTREVFEACHLQRYFDFEPDQAAAVRALASA